MTNVTRYGTTSNSLQRKIKLIWLESSQNGDLLYENIHSKAKSKLLAWGICPK